MFYNKINELPNKSEILKKLLDKVELFNLEEQTLDLNTTIASIPDVYKVANVLKSASIHPKQFYIDYYGDIPNGDDYLEKAKYSPFYAQELVANYAYWSILSKFKEGDTYALFLDKILAKTDLLFENRNGKNQNAEDLVSLTNAIFINGVPGSGKTTAVIKFLSRIFEKYVAQF